MCTAGFVIALTGDEDHIVKPDCQFQCIGLAEQSFTIFEHSEAVFDVVKRVIVPMWFLITSKQALVDSLAVVGGSLVKIPLPKRLEAIKFGDILGAGCQY